MVEMTAGRVSTMSESWLAFRHGPMSFIDPKTVIVCFLSSDPLLRAYESDLLAEISRKQLGLAKIVVGDAVPAEFVRANDVVIELPGYSSFGDDQGSLLELVVGQLLALHCSLRNGLKPDSPSENGAIHRVVEQFVLYDKRS
jgi:tagatose-6-phosphate ketose/aldose isomerase